MSNFHYLRKHIQNSGKLNCTILVFVVFLPTISGIRGGGDVTEVQANLFCYSWEVEFHSVGPEIEPSSARFKPASLGTGKLSGPGSNSFDRHDLIENLTGPSTIIFDILLIFYIIIDIYIGYLCSARNAIGMIII